MLRRTCSAILLTLLSSICLAEITSVEVENLGESKWKLSWQATEPVNISVSPSPAFIEAVMLKRQVVGKTVSVTVPNRIVRPYFLLESNNHSMKVAERLLPLEGGRNFRDLGGYTTADGQMVRWGRLFRSGYMKYLTDNDYDYLSSLGIKVVCDLRSTQERATEPTNWRAEPAARYVSWDYDTMSSGMESLFTEGVPTPERTRDFMLATYGGIVYDQKDRYARIFDELANGEIPLAFNCSAGKDRAGMAAALILTALDVDRSQIVADYALSETYVDYMAVFAGPEVEEDSPYAFLAELPPEVLMPMLRSDPAYLETAFSMIERDHGSVMSFIQNELNVTDEELAKIRAQLLE